MLVYKTHFARACRRRHNLKETLIFAAHLSIHTLIIIAVNSTFNSDDNAKFNKSLLDRQELSGCNLPTSSPLSAQPAMNMLPQPCQQPPSPPESEKSSWLTTDPKPSHAAKVFNGRLIRQNEYFLPGDGINGEVLAEELPLYLGNDASQRIGTYENRETGQIIHGYFITAYRALTTAMLDDIRADSANRALERAQYQNATHHTDCTTDQKTHQWRDVLTPPDGSIY